MGSGIAALGLVASTAAQQAQPPAKDAQAPSWQFVDVAAESGIDFKHSFGDDQFSKILEDTGSGVALIDYDNDKLLDVFLSSGQFVEGLSDPAFKSKTSGLRGRLYRNLGGLKFQDVTDEVGIQDSGFGMGAVVGDYDADGDDDLYLLNWGPNVLYRNDSDPKGRRFTDVTAELGLAGPAELNGLRKWSVNGLFFDVDRDGDLDLYVANYLAFDPGYRDPELPAEYPYEGPESYRGQQSTLYVNEAGKFRDVTREAGLEMPDGRSMGVSACDFDNDGDLDLFEAMDTMANVLWRNEGRPRGSREPVTFTNVADDASIAFDAEGMAMASMHGSIGDYDGDGCFDVFVPNLANGCLYRSRPTLNKDWAARAAAAALSAKRPEKEADPAMVGDELGPMVQFDEEGRHRGLAKVLEKSGAWGSSFHDFDLDGDLDLLVVLGGAFDLKAGENDRLFLNSGTGMFRDESGKLGPAFQKRFVSRGAAFGDLDNDGDIDYVVNVKDVGALPRVVRNDLPHAGAGADGPHWLGLELQGGGRNRDAIGARVVLRVNGRLQVRQVTRSDSYLSQSDPRLVFGLGSATKVEAAMVLWPSGNQQPVLVDGVDRYMVVSE